MYKLYDDENNYMRWVKRREEAMGLLETHPDWTVKFVREPKKVVDLSIYEEAPF
jgi:hypothetical protein